MSRTIEVNSGGAILGGYHDLLVREEDSKPWYIVLLNGDIPGDSDFYLPPKGEFILTNIADHYECSLERFKRILKLEDKLLIGNGSLRIDRRVSLSMQVHRGIAIIHHLFYINVSNPINKNTCEKTVSAIGGKYMAVEDRGGTFDIFDGLGSIDVDLSNLTFIGDALGDIF